MARWKQDYIGERRTERVTVQLTPSERALAEQRAAYICRGILSDYFRRAGLEAANNAPCMDPKLVRDIEAQLRRAGNNLNQVAHHLNLTGHLRSREELEACISDLKVAFARVIAL